MYTIHTVCTWVRPYSSMLEWLVQSPDKNQNVCVEGGDDEKWDSTAIYPPSARDKHQSRKASSSMTDIHSRPYSTPWADNFCFKTNSFNIQFFLSCRNTIRRNVFFYSAKCFCFQLEKCFLQIIILLFDRKKFT